MFAAFGWLVLPGLPRAGGLLATAQGLDCCGLAGESCVEFRAVSVHPVQFP